MRPYARLLRARAARLAIPALFGLASVTCQLDDRTLVANDTGGRTTSSGGDAGQDASGGSEGGSTSQGGLVGEGGSTMTGGSASGGDAGTTGTQPAGAAGEGDGGSAGTEGGDGGGPGGTECAGDLVDCDGKVALVCDGSNWQRTTCTNACLAGTCVACNPGAEQCAPEANLAQRCTDSGEWDTTSSCRSSTIYCGPCENGESCTEDAECLSGSCRGMTCRN